MSTWDASLIPDEKNNFSGGRGNVAAEKTDFVQNGKKVDMNA